MEGQMKCTRCGSYAINDHLHGRKKGDRTDLCDVCYWRNKEEEHHAKIEYLKEEVRWKSLLLQQRTEALYDMIQKSQDAINNLPEGMIE